MEARLTVEVQDTESLLWYSAHVVDIQDGKLTVKYTHPLFEGKEEVVEERRTRLPSVFCQNAQIEYNTGDFIEVRHRVSEEDPHGWCLAKIMHKKDEFYFVHYENYDNIYDEIVMESQIRPVNARGTVEVEKLKRHTIPVKGILINWCSSPDAEERFSTVIEKTGVYNTCFRLEEKNIVIIGEAKPVDKAAILVQFILDHQLELSQMDIENSKILKNIESKRQKLKNDAVEEVLVPKDLLGLIIGKSGANITYIKQEYGVGIHILEKDSEEAQEFTEQEIPDDKALIRIYGKDSEWVTAAKNYICLQKVTYPIEKEKVDYFRGYQNQIVNDMKEKSGCMKLFVSEARFNDANGFIEAIGNEEALEKLKMLIDAHMEYYSTHQEKQDRNRELSKQASKYNNYAAEGFYDNTGYQGNAGANRKRNKKY